MIIYGPYMIIYAPYMIIYGPYMIIYACTTIKMHVPCPTWLSSLARTAWALAPTGGPGGLAPRAGGLGELRPPSAAGGMGGRQAPQCKARNLNFVQSGRGVIFNIVRNSNLIDSAMLSIAWPPSNI